MLVGFIVKADGQITLIDLIEGSGYNHLDRAALKVIGKVGRFEPIPQLLGKNQWVFQVPLQDSLN